MVEGEIYVVPSPVFGSSIPLSFLSLCAALWNVSNGGGANVTGSSDVEDGEAEFCADTVTMVSLTVTISG